MIPSVLIPTLTALALAAVGVQVKAAPTARQAASGSVIQVVALDLCLVVPSPPAVGLGLTEVPCEQVQTTDPTETFYGLWSIVEGNQLGIELVGTGLCLDAGTNPGSEQGVPGKLWTCYPGLEQQQFYYTGDQHIAVTGGDFCLATGRNGVEFFSCGYDGADEQWGLLAPGAPPVTTTAGSPTPTPTTTVSPTTSTTTTTSSSPNPTSSGRTITDSDGNCLTVTGNTLYDGAPVGVAPCTTAPGDVTLLQLWEYNTGLTSVCMYGFCLDFGDGGGSDGTPMKIWQQYQGLFQQTLYLTGTNHIAVYNGNQCLDVEAGTSNVQSWTCSGPDPHQLWYVGIGFPAGSK